MEPLMMICIPEKKVEVRVVSTQSGIERKGKATAAETRAWRRSFRLHNS